MILKRALAGIFDLLFVSIYIFSLSFVLEYFSFVPSNSNAVTAISWGIILLYFGCLDAKVCGGGTVGKRLFGLHLRMASSRRLVSIFRSLARAVAKTAIPIVIFAVGADLTMFKGFLGFGLCVFALLILPISIIAGEGLVGVHDRLTGTYVSRMGSKYFHVVSLRTQLLLSTLITSAIALLVAAFLIYAFNLQSMTFNKFADASKQSASISGELLTGKGGEGLQPYIRKIGIMPSILEFPTDYSQSFAKVPPEIIAELKGKYAVAQVQVTLSKDNFEQQALWAAILNRIASVGAPMIISPKDVPGFFEVDIGVTYNFGPLILTDSHRFLALILQVPAQPTMQQTVVIEPPEERFVSFGFGLAGFMVPMSRKAD